LRADPDDDFDEEEEEAGLQNKRQPVTNQYNMDPSLSQALGITTGGTLIRKPSQ
jgi:hypothetical protein